MASNTAKVILSILILGLRVYQIFFTTCRLWTKKKKDIHLNVDFFPNGLGKVAKYTSV